MDNQRLSYTVDEALSAIGMGKFQLKLIAYAGVGAVGEAMELMLLSYVGLAAQHDLKLSITEQNLISIFTYVAMLVGAFAWGFVADTCGRKKAILGLSLLTSFAGLASAFSRNHMELLISRAVIGLGIGGAQVYTTWYMEFVPRAHRGSRMIWFFAFGAIGTFLEALLAWILMEVVVPEHSWRWLIGGTALPSFVALLFYDSVLESPRFLCSQGRLEEAVMVLERGAATNKKKLPEGRLVSAQIDESAEACRPPEGAPSTEVMRNQNEVTEPVVSAHIDESAEADRSTEGAPSSEEVMRNENEVKPVVPPSEINEIDDREDSDSDTTLESDTDHADRIDIEERSTLQDPLIGNKTNGDSKSKLAICKLVSAEWGRITLLIWLLYFANSYSYSSLISLLSSSFTESPIWQYGAQKKPSYYKDTVITSVAEFPGLFLAYFTLDWIGRRYTKAIMSGGGIIVILAQIYNWHDMVRNSLVFCARMLTSASFVTLQIFAEEVYPTNLRTTGVGAAAVAGWIGGMVWPALGDKLGGGHRILPMCLYAFKFIISGICALLLPVETLGRELEDNYDSE